MSTSNNSNSSNNLSNGASLEHCYTNLFSLIDLDGIKWLKLRAKDEKDSDIKKSNKKDMLNGDNEQDDDQDEEDEVNDTTQAKTTQSTPKNKLKKSESMNNLTINDPILITHAKCLKEDILSSWKRINTKKVKKINKQQNSEDEDGEDDEENDENDIDEDDETNMNAQDDDDHNRNFDLINNSNLKKELWIFWFEKEEPPNLKTIISNDLFVNSSSSNTNLSFTNNYSSNNNANSNASSLTQLALSSNNDLPYECRSMLFKALHNLIDKSLIEKGFTRLGKWFVMPYNYLNYNLNKINDDFEFDTLLKNNKNDSNEDSQQQQLNSINPQSLQSSNESNACSPLSTTTTTKPNGKGKINSNKLSQIQSVSNSLTSNAVSTSTDQFNHVSYSFSFFLHGSSRVCTSVDMKLHKPLRIINTNDLYKIKLKMQQSFSFQNKKNKQKFKGLNVILAPYGISAKLIGYLSNDSVQSKLTCQEWQQFYSLKFYSNLPRILVVGLEKNKIKLFYPNSFVFMIVKDDEKSLDFYKYESNQYNLDLDTDLILSDLNNSAYAELDDNQSNGSLNDQDSTSTSSESNYFDSNTTTSDETESETSTDDDENKENQLFQKSKSNKNDPAMPQLSQQQQKPRMNSKQKTKLGRTNSLNSGIDLITKTDDKKEMDSLELTIDSVARNFGNSSNKGDSNQVDINNEDDEPMFDELNDEFEISNQEQEKHKSPIVIKKEPIDSPSKSIKRIKISKTTNLKQKCKSFSAYSTTLTSRPKTKSIKFNQKTTDSNDKELKQLLIKLNSDQYLTSLFNSSKNHASKMKNLIKLYLNNKQIQRRIDSFKAKNLTKSLVQRRRDVLNLNKLNKRLNSIRQFRVFVSNYNYDNSKDLNYYSRLYKLKHKHKRFKSKCSKCNRSQQQQISINNSLSTSFVSSSNDDSTQLVTSPIKSFSCKCCKFDYSTENHILLRHKQVDLINENLPLSFDLLDKCQLNITNSNQRHLTVKPQNKISFQPQTQHPQCKCNDIDSGSKTPNKTKPTVKQESTEPESIETKQIKLEPFSITTIKSEPSSQSSQITESIKPKINVINIQTQSEPFHQRQCYFTTHTTHSQSVLLNVNKTIQLNNNKILKEIKTPNQTSKMITITDEYIENEEDKSIKCDCKQKEAESQSNGINDDAEVVNAEIELDSDSSDDSTKDFMKEIEKMEKKMTDATNLSTEDDTKRVENELKNFILHLNKNDYNSASLSDNEIIESKNKSKFLNEEKLDDDLKTGQNSNQLNENDYQFFTLDDNDSLLEAFRSNKDLEVKSEKSLKLLSSSESSSSCETSSSGSISSSDTEDDDESLSSLSTTEDSSTTITTDSDESNLSQCKTSSSSNSSDEDSDHNADLLLIKKPLNGNNSKHKKMKKLNLDNYLISNENQNTNSRKKFRKFKCKEDFKKSDDSKKSIQSNIDTKSTTNVVKTINNIITSEQNIDDLNNDNTIENEDESEDVTFDKLYELTTRLEQDNLSESQPNNIDKLDETQQQNLNPLIQPPQSNKQMTPPKSVESIHLTQPLSNNPDLLKPTNILINKTLVTSTNMAPKYEDISHMNIFEEEESADEQQQQQQVASQAPVQPLIAENGQDLPTNSVSNKLTLPTFISSVATPTPCLSVVMTPPSHENIQQINQINQNQLNTDDLFSSASSQTLTITTSDTEFTKSIKLNDYMTLTKNKQREKFTSLLVKSLDDTKTNNLALNDITDKLIVNKYNKLNLNLNESDEKKKIKKLKKEYSNLTKLKWMPPTTTNESKTSTSVNQLNGFELKKTIKKKLSPKKEFKSLIKSISLSLDKINNSVNNYKLVKNTNSTYIHLNPTNKHNNSSVIIIDSPQQTQSKPNQPLIQRTNSTNVYQSQQPASVSNQLNASYTAPSTPINTQQYYSQQVASPYHYQQPPLSVNSVNSYPGSVPPPPSNFNQTPTNNQNNTLITNPGSVGPNLNNTSQLNYSQQMSINNNTTLPIESPDTTSIVPNITKKEDLIIQDLTQIKLKPLENVSILNEKNFKKSNLNLKLYLNSLNLSLNLSDSFNNCYRDINFDSCTLCVCNNNLKGLDYYIYILNDLFNSTSDHYNDNFNNLNKNQANESDDDIYETVNEQQQIKKSLFKGLYLINKDKKLKGVNKQKSSIQKQDDPTTPSNQLCTCGFSAIVNRQLMSSKAIVINLNQYIKDIKKLKSQNSSSLVTYLKLIELINSTLANNKYSLYDKQYLIINSNNCNGLFYEDYLESLNLNVPNSLLKQLVKLTNSNSNQKNIKNFLINTILIRDNYKWKKSFSLKNPTEANSSEDDSKKQKKHDETQQIVKKKQQFTLNDGTQLINNSIDLTDENQIKKQSGQFEHIKQNLLDFFDQKYSCAFLSIQEQHDLFYSNERLFNNFTSDSHETSIQPDSESIKLMTLNQLDENKSYLNVLKRLLIKTSKTQPKNFKFKFKKNLIHKWLYDKKEIKSNLELTKSLKQIQPLLEETVQKKYTTSKMWESFQGPLTWQHFCRLAFRDTSSNNISSHHHQNLLNNQPQQSTNPSMSSNSTSSSNSSSSTSTSSSSSLNPNQSSSNNSTSNSAQQQHQLNCYEPEPIPSLLVSFDKEWLAISPYAIKFWDKLNLEPYSKPKNIAYIVLVPDFDSLYNIDFESLNIKNINFEENDPFNYSKKSTFYHQHHHHHHHNLQNKRASDQADSYEAIIQSIKDYFKELTSTYELCRLGLHRPALRIAPDNGFIRVPLYRASNASISSSSSSSNLNKPNPQNKLNFKTPDLQAKDPTDLLIKQEEDINAVPTGIIGFSKINSSDNLIIKDLQASTNRIQIDQWFDQLIDNKSINLIGKNLRSYARIFKLLALKITNGYQSTLSSTIQTSFFATNNSANISSTSTNSSQPTSASQSHTFASTIIPTHSAINLDRTIYEEYKPSRYANTQQAASVPIQNNNQTTSNSNLNQTSANSDSSSSSSLLSNLLNQNVQPIEINLELSSFQFNHHHNPTSPLDLHSQSLLAHHPTQQQSAQILTNYNQQNQNLSNQIEDNLFSSSTSSSQNLVQLQQQQHQSQKAQQPQNTSIHLTQNITSSPVLFVYIIDPFDYYLYNTKKSQQTNKKSYKTDESLEDDEFKFSEYDMKRLRQLGLFKAYLELVENIPDLFKYSLQFQIIPLSLILDLQQQSTSLYLQSIMQLKTCKSNYSSCFATGYGTGCSDFDMDFKLSLLKQQSFNVFSLSKRFFMSPGHNYYLQMQQQQLQQYNTRSKTLTYFGPTGSEERFLKDNLIQAAQLAGCKPNKKLVNLDQMKKWSFYSPLFVLAPSTISNSTVALAASNLFFKSNSQVNTPQTTSKSTSLNQQQQQHNIGLGDCNLLMPNFIQLNMSNSNYGYLTNNPTIPASLSNNVTTSTTNSNNRVKNDVQVNTNSIIQQPYQQQCNVLFVTYCLSEDQRYLLTSCCDENGELLESTSINIEIDERDRRKNNQYARLTGLRKLWEFLITLISQTCKPWRLVIGRLGRIGHSELRGWSCLLSKKNLQRVCSELKESCEQCNIFGNMEMPSILSACLISMESCDNICIYPESFSREDKLAAAALSGQQLSSNHLAQSYGVSCTHILTFPASAFIQPQQQSSSIISNKDGSADPLSKSDGLHPMDDFFDLFGAGIGDDEEMMADLMNDDVNAKGFNESGNNNESDHLNNKQKVKEALLNQEEMQHLDQQPLAVGYYISTAKSSTPLPDWLRGDVSLDTNFHSFKATLHIHNRYALDNDELIMQMKTEYSHKLDSSITYEVLRYVLERYNALSWLNIDPLTQDRKSCLPLHHTALLQLYYAFKNYV